MLGAAARDALEQALPASRHGFPLATLLINLGGAFLLGLLLEILVRTGPDRGWRRRARLAAGTGFLGAFTTYSTFAVEADLLVRSGRSALAAGYVLASVAGGLAAAAAGIGTGARGGRGRTRPASRWSPVDPDVDAEECA